MGVGFKIQKMGESGLECSKNGWEWVGAQNGNSLRENVKSGQKFRRLKVTKCLASAEIF